MLQNNKIAIRYANVFLAEVIESGNLTSISTDLYLLQNQFNDHPSLDGLLNNPTIPCDEKKKLLKNICGQPLNYMLWRFLDIIIEQHQIGLLKKILTAFFIGYRDYIGVRSAILTTAVALPESFMQRMIDEVKKWVPCKEVLMEQQIDPSIIGGYILQIGPLKLDRSIKHYLHGIQDALR